ncbi:MAG: penicillin-binding protein 2, partial [Clostridia bacterium]|nr:penicillin-binding protein 2 [Clostridia bacterium]
MSRLDPERLEHRRDVLVTLMAVAVLVLLGRLAWLQVVQGAYWREMASGQRLRAVTVPAPRGEIFDRRGIPLATNEPAFTVSLVYTGKPLPDRTVQLLAELLHVDAAVIRQAAETLRPGLGRPYEPVVLKVGLTPEEYVRLEEHREDLTGVVVDVRPVRRYPGLPDFPDLGGTLAAHVLGYLQRADAGPGARGSYGLEASYDVLPEGVGLRGRDGVRQVEVDFQGRPARVIDEELPVPGANLRLTLDARLQAVAERALLQRMEELRQLRNRDCPSGCPADAGAAVVLDVRTGAVLAMASKPGFDPNLFARRVYALPGSQEYRQFQDELARLNASRGQPFYNHATQDAAPPGSTFKPVTALAALREGVTQPRERIRDTGAVRIGNVVFRDWKNHGSVDLEQAL